ncbi:MAG: N-acetylmuramoyl-L-alanine amidase [Actinomycetota bacterium]
MAGIAAVLLGLLSLSPASVQQQPPPPVRPSPATIPSGPPGAASTPAQPGFLVVVDPSHGGADKGAVFAPRIFEKDITLSLARMLRKELETRGVAVRMLRDSDVKMDLDHRAELCNHQQPALYVALHAGEPGRGVRVYSSFLAVTETAVGRFLPWDSAQAKSLQRSQAVARAVTRELQKRDLKAVQLQAFLRPLNNVVAPAIAVEIAVDRTDVRSVENPKLQGTVASAIASAIEQVRDRPGVSR